jgi:lysine 2,3-aminomutase
MRQDGLEGDGYRELRERFPEAEWEGIARTAAVYPAAVTSCYARLIAHPGDPLWRQCIPDPAELDGGGLESDPLAEERYSPLPGLVHRYPDRVLLLAADRCPLYCRFCTRKRRIGRPRTPEQLREDHAAACRYIAGNPAIRDVLVSGGDPLTLPDDMLCALLDRLAAIPHLALIRLGTRALCTWPERISEALAEKLARYPALWINTHFNHPAELTAAARTAARRLWSRGIPLASQTVLLRGVNDSAGVLRELFMGLVSFKIRPYYLHLMDLVRGTGHFRVSLARALQLYGSLQGAVSGMAIPRMMLDLPGGGGKIPLTPEYLGACRDGVWQIRNWEGELFSYPEVGADG